MSYAYKGEAQFLAWGDGPQGPWIKLKLPDSDDLGPFRGMTQAKATQAGQVLAVGIVELVGEEASPAVDARVVTAATNAVKGGDLCKLAAILCADENFQRWLLNDADIDDMPTFADAAVDEEERAAIVIRRMCGIASRRELDHNEEAASIFHELIRKPWNRHCQGEAGNCA